MSNQFDQNIEYLKTHQKQIYKSIETYSQSCNDQKAFSLIEGNVINIEYKTDNDAVLLYSKYDPVHECERWLSSYNIPNHTNSDFVLYGMGLTYHLAAIIERYPNKKIFLYEPEVEVFLEALKVINIEQICSHKNIVVLSVGKDNESLNIFSNYLYYYAQFPIHMVDIPIYRSIDINQFLKFLKLVEKVSVGKLFKEGFHKMFDDSMYINSIKNLKTMMNTPSIEIFKEKYKGSTALVVGGGPSLQYDIEYIKQMSDDVLIIAAGSSVQSLMYYGIEPHLVISMDPGINNYNVFARNDFSELPLMFMPQIHHQIVEEHTRYNVFGYYNNDPVINYLLDVKNKDYVFIPTFSVTGTAIQVAIYLGASTVVLSGQDLSHPDKLKYAPGAIHLDSENTKSDHQLTEEVPNVLGGFNPTTFNMKKTLENIEEIIDLYENVKFFNTSSKGAVIKGTEFVHIEKVFQSEKVTDFNYKEIKEILSTQHVRPANSEFEALASNVEQLVSDLNEIYRESKGILNLLDKLVKQSKKDFFKAEKLLRQIERQWGNIISTTVFKDVIAEWIPLEINRYDKKILDISHERDIVKKSAMLNTELGALCKTMTSKIVSMRGYYQELLQ